MVVDDKHKRIKCGHLQEENKRKKHRDVAIDHQNLVKLVTDTKKTAKESQDDEAFHDMLSKLPKGCVAKMNDLGEKLGHL